MQERQEEVALGQSASAKRIAAIMHCSSWHEAARQFHIPWQELRQWAVNNGLPDYMIGRLDATLSMKETDEITQPGVEIPEATFVEEVEKEEEEVNEPVSEPEIDIPDIRPIRILEAEEIEGHVKHVYTVERVRAAQRRKVKSYEQVQQIVDRLNIWYTCCGEQAKIRELVGFDDEKVTLITSAAYRYKLIVPREMWGPHWGEQPRRSSSRERLLEERIKWLEENTVPRSAAFSIVDVRRVWQVPFSKALIVFRPAGWVGKQVYRRARAIVRAVVRGE